METTAPSSSIKTAAGVAKALVVLLFGVSVIIFNVYMYGVFNQTGVQLNEQKANIDQLTKDNITLKDQLKQQMDDVKKDIQEQKDAILSQKAVTQETQNNIDKLTAQIDQVKVIQDREIKRLDFQQESMKKQLDEGSKDIAALKNQNKEWQKDYVVVLANLDKLTKGLGDKLTATRADFLGRMSAIEARLDKIDKQLNAPETDVKPSVLHKRLSNDALGLQDITDSKSIKSTP